MNNESTVVSISFKWNDKQIKNLEKGMILGIFEMGYDIAAQARRNAPVVTSALRNSIRVEEDGNTIYIKAGGIIASGIQKTREGSKTITRNVDYAMKREQGPNRNPATEHYMKHAQEAIMTGDYMAHYFRGIL